MVIKRKILDKPHSSSKKWSILSANEGWRINSATEINIHGQPGLLIAIGKKGESEREK